MEYNKYQTPITQEVLDALPDEIRDQFEDYILNIPYINYLISPDRKYAKDLPRDKEGRIIVDLAHPHILENMDYFRESALHYKKYGVYTFLRPNANPNSDYGKWLRRERDRCWYGMVRPEDGEWITGDMYFYLNYNPIIQTKIKEGAKFGERVVDFPEVWDGVYLAFHYIDQARNGGLYNNFEGGENAAEIAKRGASKSYQCASKAAKYFILGESRESCQKVKSLLSAYQKEYLTKDGTLNKFIDTINFCAENTQFPSLRTKDSLQEMTWKMGYKDKDTGIERGSKNEVLGVSAKDDPDKMRGKRVNLMIYEEFGNWPKFLDTYRVCLPNVKEGDTAFGLAFAIGTGGSEGADFMGAYELIYNPLGYDIYAIPNVYDKGSNGEQKTIYFFPAYLNYKGLYDNNGNSDITAALLKLLQTRYKVKYNSSDPMALTRTKAENPITIQDAIMKRDSTIYPVAEINDRIQYLLTHKREIESSWAGTLGIENGKIIYKPDGGHKVIRFFPHKDNKLEGAVEIYAMPELDKDGKPQSNRYIAGIDPYDDDVSNTMSLGSLFILDLFTDKIVLEYTGRPRFAEDFYEMCRRCLLFYDARCNYENNKKGLFTYFSKMNCVYLLTETLDFLKDKDPTKANYYGNKSRGTAASEPVKAYGRRCIRDWLLKPMPIIPTGEDDKETEEEVFVPQLDSIKSIPLLKELAMWNSQDNFDRHDALAMLMLLREDRLRLLGVESPSEAAARADKNYLGDDDFFVKNFRTYGGDIDPRIAKLFGMDEEKSDQI